MIDNFFMVEGGKGFSKLLRHLSEYVSDHRH